MYAIGQTKIWYTAGVTSSPHYLRVLLSAPALAAQGWEVIPHGKLPTFYKAILQGKGPPKARARKPDLAIGDSDGARVRPPAPPIRPAGPADPEDDPPAGPADPEDDPPAGPADPEDEA